MKRKFMIWIVLRVGCLITDNSVNEKGDFEVKKKESAPEPKQGSGSQLEREMVFTGPFNKVEPVKEEEEEGEEGLFRDDEYDHSSEKYGDQVINEEGMMELRNTKQRLATTG